MKRRLILTVSMLLLAACGQPGETSVGSAEMLDAKIEPSAPGASPAAGAPIPVSIPQLAYRYDYELEAPAKALPDLLARHEGACRAAGEAVCQITGSSLTRDGERRVDGELSLRARPAWLTQFRSGLTGEAKEAGGRVTRSNTETEDLSTQIVDTEARVRASITLRDRLQTLLATRSGSLEDLLAVERQLAQVQGEIDAAQSTLAMMRQRVATSAMTLAYRSEGTLSEEGAWAPVAQAIRGSQSVVASVVAALILVVAGLTPLVVLTGLIWLAVKRFRPKGRKASAKTGDSTPPAP